MVPLRTKWYVDLEVTGEWERLAVKRPVPVKLGQVATWVRLPLALMRYRVIVALIFAVLSAAVTVAEQIAFEPEKDNVGKQEFRLSH